MHNFEDRCFWRAFYGIGSGTLANIICGAYGELYARDLLAEAAGVTASRVDLVLECAFYAGACGIHICLLCFVPLFPLYVWVSGNRRPNLWSKLEAGVSCGLLVGLVFWFLFQGMFFQGSALIGSTMMGATFALVDGWFFKHYSRF